MKGGLIVETLKIIMNLLNCIDNGNLREAEEMFQLLWKIKELYKFSKSDIGIVS